MKSNRVLRSSLFALCLLSFPGFAWASSRVDCNVTAVVGNGTETFQGDVTSDLMFRSTPINVGSDIQSYKTPQLQASTHVSFSSDAKAFEGPKGTPVGYIVTVFDQQNPYAHTLANSQQLSMSLFADGKSGYALVDLVDGGKAEISVHIAELGHFFGIINSGNTLSTVTLTCKAP